MCSIATNVMARSSSRTRRWCISGSPVGRSRPESSRVMPPALIVFDLDGTLIDSAADLAAAVNGMLARYGCEPLTVPEVRRMIGDGVAMLVARALAARHCEDADPVAAGRTFTQHYESNATSLTTAFPGAAEALQALRAAGIALAVCTNKPSGITAGILGHLGLAKYF